MAKTKNEWTDEELMQHVRASLLDAAAHGHPVDEWPVPALLRREVHQRTMRWLIIEIAILLCVLVGLLVAFAQAQDAVTTAADVQAGTVDVSPCDTTNLPMGVWTLVLFDDAGNPCTTHASQLTGTCDPDSNWNWTVDGHLVFTTAPGYHRVRVRVQTWAGGGACHGGTGDPIVCDNPEFKTLKSDETYEIDMAAIDADPTTDAPGTALAVPINILSYLLAPYFETPSDANYQGIWTYAMPIGRPAVCQSASYHDFSAN